MSQHNTYWQIRINKRWFVGIVAILASLSVHLPVYEVLGVLAKIFHAEEANRKKVSNAPVEIDFDALSPDSKQPSDEIVKPKLPKPVEETKAVEKKEVVAKAIEPPKVIPNAFQQAIKQKSQDPSVPPPDDPKYVANENSRVKEETVARIRSYSQDSQEQSAGRLKEQSTSEDKNPGNSDQEQTGGDSEDRAAENRAQPPAPSSRSASAAPPSAGGVQAQPGERLITDKFGTFAVRQPAPGRPGPAPHPDAVGAGPASQGPLAVNWSKFADAVGQDKLRDDREIYQYAKRLRRSKIRGGNAQVRWQTFKAAIENFTPSVKAGNQTALNAAASPFANYLTEVHILIHQEFADRFIPNIPAGTSPLNDPNLVTTLEVILNKDGTVHRVGVVSSSGILQFDYGAFSAVMNGAPYPEAPSSILSGDGRVYFHWGFYRNERQCGTFNAQAFILPNPPPSQPIKDLLNEPVLQKNPNSTPAPTAPGRSAPVGERDLERRPRA